MNILQAESAQLVALNLSQKSLTNLSVSCLIGCELIQILDVSSNKLTKLFENETILPNLIDLNAQNNRISQLQYLPSSLLVLNISHNSIYSLSNLLFAQCQQLHYIDLSYNRLAHDLTALTKAPALQQLNLSYNKIVKESAVTQLAGCRQLRMLNIAGNQVIQDRQIDCKRILRNALPHLEELIMKEQNNQHFAIQGCKEQASNQFQVQNLHRERSSTKTRSSLNQSPISRKVSNIVKDTEVDISEKKDKTAVQNQSVIESEQLYLKKDIQADLDCQPSLENIKLDCTPKRKKWNISANNSSNKRNNHIQVGKNNLFNANSLKKQQFQSAKTPEKTKILSSSQIERTLNQQNQPSSQPKPVEFSGYQNQPQSTIQLHCADPIDEFDKKQSSKLQLKIGRLEETQAMKEVLIQQQQMMIESFSQELGEGKGFTSLFEKNMYLIYQQSKCDILLLAFFLSNEKELKYLAKFGDYSDVQMDKFITQLDVFSNFPDPIKLSVKKPLADQLIEVLINLEKEEQC